MTDDSALDDLPVGTLVVVGALLLAALTLPTFAPGTGPEEPNASNGTIVTPDGTELEEVNRGPLEGLNVLPASHLDDSPTVHASAGTQTMRVETTIVDGEPALNLSDDRTHDGRWVAVPTEWFNETQGEVPGVARIAHENGGTYTESIQVRGDSAAFYVREFSTNTVTFGGELVIRDRPAVDGTRHSYQLDSRDSVDDLSINVTGVENTAQASTSGTFSDGDSTTLDVGGTTNPRDETVTLTGVVDTEQASTSGTFSDGDSTTINVGGTTAPRDAEITFSGSETTSSTKSTSGIISDSNSDTISIEGNTDTNVDVKLTPKSTGGSPYEGQQFEPLDVSNTDYLTDIEITGGYQAQYERWAITSGTNDDIIYDISDNEYPIQESPNIDVSEYDTIYLKTTDNYQDHDGASWSGEKHPKNTEVSIGSSSASFGTVTEPTTKTITASSGDQSVSLSTSNSRNVDYEATWTETTATEDPSVTVGGSTASVSGVLREGETVTKSIGLSTGSQSLDISTGYQVGVNAEWTEVSQTEDPSVTIGGETVSHSGLLDDGEAVTKSVDLSTGAQSLETSTGHKVGVNAEWTEVSQTTDPVVEVNGNETTGYSGTLADGETVSLDASSDWVVDGTNNVTVRVGDGSYSGVGPEPKVNVEYRHDLESPRTVTYEGEALSERYNISKTYTTTRADATLTVPHARNVLSMRSVEYRLNETGSWSSVPQSSTNLSGTRLTIDVSSVAGNPVPEGTTVEVRSVGSRVDAHNAEISVEQATPVGFDLDSRVRLDSWSSDSYLAVGETPQGGLVTYGTNESWSTETDYVELYGDGTQQFYAPNASSGSEVTLNTLSARVSPEQNSMSVRVPESANATSPQFVVEPASVVGDSWTAEYVAGTDGQWYGVVDDSGDELAAAQKPDAIEVNRDDVGLVSIEPTDEPTAADSGTVGGGVFATLTTGNLPSLTVLFGGVAMLFVAGTRPDASRTGIDGVAGSLGDFVSRVPRIGPALGSGLEAGVSSIGNALVSIGENRLLSGALAAAVAVAAAQAGLYQVGSEAGAILAVGGIAVGSLYVLREAGEFTTARWIAIVAVAGVVALQGLGEGDLLAQFVDSDAFLIAVLLAGYAAIQLVREYRENNGPNDDRPQIVFNADDGSGNDGGSD